MSHKTSNTRRRLVQGLGAAPLAAAWGAPSAAGEGERKVLRVLFQSAETSLDPARISDLYSRTLTAHIFEALYTYDHLARPAKVKPLTADGLPQVSEDFRTWTIKLRRGIFFPPDPAFKGRPRELVARDYIYALQRVVDPANISPVEAEIADMGIIGLAEARQAALKGKKPFDYDAPIEGLQTPDSHTLRITLNRPRPRLLFKLAASDVLGGVARELVEFYGDKISEHPVGTGPFRLKFWRRSSKIVLERNPHYREVRYEAEPAPDDAAGQALLARFKGRRLPMVDEVDVSIVEEFQPEWLSFLNAEVDALAGQTGQLPSQFAPVAIPGGKLAPHLAKKGVQAFTQLTPDLAFMYFNMQDPVVGGMAPAQVALRRAISLAYDPVEEIRNIRRGQAVVGQSLVMPHTRGYDPKWKSEMGDHDPARARSLLDLYGFADRDGDGWRERPDGSPLELVMATEPEQIYRAYNELFKKSLNAVGLRVRFEIRQWPENLKNAEAGKLMMWMLGTSAVSPDAQDALASLYTAQAGNNNLARFSLPEFDQLYDRVAALPDGPERDALVERAKRIMVAYMPYKVQAHRVFTDLLHPWVSGFRRPLFWNEWWHMVDVDMALRRQRLKS
ncbi:ABC-type dipeptide transport system, periplasmic component [Burkholderiales bacterium JOSHI_001]|nr:ABC-type dipeptide transport system, periplasmic component [Burkholderiales bacterium JOSHI_001]